MIDAAAVGPDILLVSNGFGEAAIAGYIARAIAADNPSARIEHLLLVGRADPSEWPPAVGPSAHMPSGGLVTYWNVRNFARDLRAGLGGLTLAQFRYLTRQRQRDAIVAVGDIFCLALCLVAARCPTVFVATAKSDLVAPHSRLELAIARKAMVTFARDAATAAKLKAAGVNATFAGNIMMDGLNSTGAHLGVAPGALVVAVLPGSRSDAGSALGEQMQRLRAFSRLAKREGHTVQALVSIAPSADEHELCQAVEHHGVQLVTSGSTSGVIASGADDDLQLSLVRGAFGDLIGCADIVFGQAGTGNEQAAGSGKPVLAAAVAGEDPNKMGWYRMRQKKLLGDALLVLPGEPDVFAAEALRLINDPARMAHMAAVGRDRMGPPGGAAAVAKAALAIAAKEQNT